MNLSLPLYWRMYLQLICPITFVSVSLWSIDSVCCAHIGVSSVEIKTEADHNDLIECSHADKPSTGMFAIYFFVCIFCVSCMPAVASKKKLLQYCLYLFVCFSANNFKICWAILMKYYVWVNICLSVWIILSNLISVHLSLLGLSLSAKCHLAICH